MGFFLSAEKLSPCGKRCLSETRLLFADSLLRQMSQLSVRKIYGWKICLQSCSLAYLGITGNPLRPTRKSLCKAQRLGSHSQMNPDMHSECTDISTCTQPLAKREHLITLEIISTSTATQREPSASGTQVLGWTTAGRRHRRVGSLGTPTRQRLSLIVSAIKM